MYCASVEKIVLQFKIPAGTSRGILKDKNSWIIKIWQKEQPTIIGTGEASILESLSPEWSDDYPAFIEDVCLNIDKHIQNNLTELTEYPSIRLAIESALLDLINGGEELYYPSDFTSGADGIKINGLIWMGDKEFMHEQIEAKIEAGYSCIKLKIGAIDFETEIELLKSMRQRFSANTIELRVDANGAFMPNDALQKLEILASLDLHSIEQPIKQGQWEQMQQLCQSTPLPIALDEELIGINDLNEKKRMLNQIAPQYIILKPSLIGGFSGSDEWIALAEQNNIGWWITSALESNVGLNAIAQYTFTKNSPMPQGLGTGQLFTNNSDSPLKIIGEKLYHQNS